MKIILLSLFILFQMIVFAQQNNESEEAFLKQLESTSILTQSQNELSYSNTAQIQQIGSNNNASINQALTGISVSGNVAMLIQSGDLNNAVLTQNGSGNSHNITKLVMVICLTPV